MTPPTENDSGDSEQPSMIWVDGFWVHQGDAPAGFDWSRMVDDDRERRIRELSHV